MTGRSQPTASAWKRRSVGQQPREGGRRHVDRDVDRHQLARPVSQHSGSLRPSASSTKARIALLEDLAAVRLGPGSKGQSIKARRFEGTDGGPQRRGGGLAEDDARCGRAPRVSGPPPSPKTTAGRPQASASRGTIPASSTPGIRTARQPAVQLAQLLVADACRGSAASGGARARSRASSGPVPDDPQGPAGAAVGVEHQLEALVGGEGGDDEVVGAGAVVAGGEEGGVDGRRDDARRRGRSSAGCGRPRRRCSRRSGGRGRRSRTSQARRRAATGRMASARQGRGAARAEVVVEAVPDVAHRRVAVAQVQGARARAARPWRRSGSSRARGRSPRGRSDSAAAGKSGR